jgi:alpha-beta hydrolase superfamily lysophospholipase
MNDGGKKVLRNVATNMKVPTSRRSVIKLVTGLALGTEGALGIGTPANARQQAPSNTRGGGRPMNLMFDDPMYERQASWILAQALYGGADFGECLTTAKRIREGDAASWYRAWTETADRVFKIAEECAANGHVVSAREAYLRASTYYRASYIFLFGAPVDPLLVAAFDREVDTFLKAAALFDPAIEPVEIPFEGTTLPGYFYRVDNSGRPRPTVIATNGYDSTIQQMHFGHAVAAVRRGYNCLLFDGPGQGRVLIKQGLPIRPDWETVVTPVVDYALSRPEVDPKRLALVGWSFGGYLAPRAASSEQRLAALIADPGQWDMLEAVKEFLTALPEAKLNHPETLTDADLQPYTDQIMEDLSLRWTFVQRGFWVHGVSSLREYVQAFAQFKLSKVVGEISCPTLITQAESDPVAAYADKLYAALRCPKTLIRFTDEEGAGDHCESMARSLYHQRAFDWLDDALGLRS